MRRPPFYLFFSRAEVLLMGGWEKNSPTVISDTSYTHKYQATVYFYFSSRVG